MSLLLIRLIHGSAVVRDETFVGIKVLVFKSRVGSKCVLAPGCIVMGVNFPDGHYVPTGSVIRTQQQVDELTVISDDYPMKAMNKGVVHVNTALAKGSLAAAR